MKGKLDSDKPSMCGNNIYFPLHSFFLPFFPHLHLSCVTHKSWIEKKTHWPFSGPTQFQMLCDFSKLVGLELPGSICLLYLSESWRYKCVLLKPAIFLPRNLIGAYTASTLPMETSPDLKGCVSSKNILVFLQPVALVHFIF